MVDKDDLFQDEDDTNPQGQDRDEPSSEDDDDIIDLLDTVELSAEDMEKDIIDLKDMVEAPDDGIIELTEKAQESAADDDVIDLTAVVTDEDELQDDILELTDMAAADDAEDDGVLDIIQKTEASDIDDGIFDPTETTDEDEVFDLLDTVEVPAGDVEKNSFEPADITQEIDVGDHIFDPTETTDEDEAATDLTEMDDVMEPERKERFEETVALPSAGYEEDKELLELIDDIQATLNDEPVAARVGDQEDTPLAAESFDADTTLDNDDGEYTFLDDNELIEEGNITESETEFVDHLGIDLTSEIERKALDESQEAVMEDVKPTESMDAGITPGALETAVKQALSDMLADENNPLTKAIENAVRKALGQGEDI